MLIRCNADAKIPNFRPSNAATCTVQPAFPPLLAGLLKKGNGF